MRRSIHINDVLANSAAPMFPACAQRDARPTIFDGTAVLLDHLRVLRSLFMQARVEFGREISGEIGLRKSDFDGLDGRLNYTSRPGSRRNAAGCRRLVRLPRMTGITPRSKAS
jgi:hypothetical protein